MPRNNRKGVVIISCAEKELPSNVNTNGSNNKRQAIKKNMALVIKKTLRC
jgi:hypothetical protein